MGAMSAHVAAACATVTLLCCIAWGNGQTNGHEASAGQAGSGVLDTRTTRSGTGPVRHVGSASARTRARRPATGRPVVGARFTRAKVEPVDCEYRDCWTRALSGDEIIGTLRSGSCSHGDVRVYYSSARSRLVRTSDLASAEPPPLLSPDRTTVGWTAGTHQKCTDWSVGGTMFVNSKLVLYREGKPPRVMAVPGTFIERWAYRSGGRQVVVRSRWHHGAAYIRLFEAATGRLLEKVPAYVDPMPDWARAMAGN